MMTEYNPELIERLVSTARDIAAVPGTVISVRQRAQIHAIVAELPAPVDPDLLLAREVAASEGAVTIDHERLITSGDDDRKPYVRIALAAIKRVRAERQEAR
jgi:hypothetical protein